MIRVLALFCAALALLLTGSCTPGFAWEVSPERSLRNTAAEMLKLTAREGTEPIAVTDLAVLRDLQMRLQAGHLLMTERMRQRGDLLQGRKGVPAERHRLVAARYQALMDRLLPLLQRVSTQANGDRRSLKELRTLLEQLAPPQPRPLHGLLPYGRPEFAPRRPVMSPQLTPAYRLSTHTPSNSADLADTPEAPLTPVLARQAREIAAQVGRSHWDPAAIYNWVRENIRTECYWGAMKGAEETLRQRSGNDADQAALLVALLRASGYPARYVRGVIEFFPGLESAIAMTGIADPVQLLEFFQSAGVPCEPVYDGTRIENLRIEHVWVEALVPYANYRGVVADAGGQLWVPLDTSIKTGAVVPSTASDLPSMANNPLPGFRDRYLNVVHDQTPLAVLAQETGEFLAAAQPGLTFTDTLHQHAQRSPSLEILPGTLQFVDVAVTGEYAALPADLLHQLHLTATVDERIIFEQTVPLHRLSNRKVMVGFVPETVADQEEINLWGGLDNTPAYLVRLRPTLLLDEEQIVVGREGLAPGENFVLTAEFVTPAGTVVSRDTVPCGYPLLLGIVAQQALPPAKETLVDRAEDWLHRSALAYIAAWDRDEQSLADLLDLAWARPLPAYVVVGGTLRSEILAGEVISAEWEGLFVDANLRRVSAIPRKGGDPERVKTFMELSALSGSVYEHRLFVDEFGVAGISTARLLALARQDGLPMLTLDSGNAAALLPTLALAPEVLDDVAAAVAQGLQVRLPSGPVSSGSWRGIGYLKENPETGEAGYMLSGGLAGGQTILGRRDWPDELAAVLAEPFTGPPNDDPAQAFSLIAVTPPAVRLATSGEELSAPLMTLVRDAAGVPVVGALVTYTVHSGGGWLIDDRQTPPGRVSTFTVVSGRDGIARARFVPGEQTASNPVVFVRDGDRQANLVGENLVDARLLSGSQAGLVSPLAIFGFAGLPDPLLSRGYGNNLRGEVFSYSGDVLLLLKDRFGNPVANHPVEFSVAPVQPAPASRCQNPPGLPADRRDARLVGDDPCRQRSPVYGECAAGERVSTISRSDGGALAGVVLGGVPAAAYPVTASFAASSGIRQHSWTHHSNPFASCSKPAAPENRLLINYPQRLDAAGNNVDARPPGVPVKLQVKSFLLAEEAVVTVAGETITCNDSASLTCDLVAGNGAFAMTAPGQVTIAASPAQRVATLPGSLELPWLYQGEVTLPSGLSEVMVEARASRSMPRIINSCSGCGTLEPAVAVNIGPSRRALPLWGVAVQGPNAVTVLVNSQGIAQRDLRFNYAIQPAAYVANQAQVMLFRNGELWDTLPGGTSGDASVTFPAGYWFDPHGNYELQVLLNNAGEANAIRSRRIPLLQRTASVDLRIDELADAVEDQVGAFVLFNNDFDEQEADPAVTLPDAATPAILTTDNELKRAWLQIDDSSGLGGSWRVHASDPARLRIYHRKNDLWVEFAADDPPEPVTDFPAIIPLYLEGVAESARIHGETITATFYPAGGASVGDTVPATVVDVDMAVDGNRDRAIDFQRRHDEQATFWVNNDHDYRHEEVDQPVEDDAATGDDSRDAVISCMRDLEDFTRLHLRLGAAALPGPLAYTVQLVAEEGAVQPMLNLYPAINLSDGYLGLPGDGATPEQPGEQLLKRLAVSAGRLQAALPASTISIRGENPFLFEGRMPGRGQLLLTASYLGVPVFTRSVDLELVDPTWFYDHFVVSQTDAGEESPVRPAINPEGLAHDASRLGHYQPGNSDYVLFVHGWNMQGWEKRRWAETVFKRLWWQGYQGKVGLFDWPCRTLPSWDFLVNYDRSEFLAWQSATALKGVLESLQGEHAGKIRLLAHSQGNVVAGEALRLGDAGLVHTYVASQAALSAGLHESGLPLIRDFEPTTPDVMSSYPAHPDRTPYFAQLTGGVGSIFNYYNARDYALAGDSVSQPTWLLNNRTRPDGLLGYGYQGETTSYPPQSPALGFYRIINGVNTGGEAVMEQRRFPENCYEIFSFCTQSRNYALGAANVTCGGKVSGFDLENIGFNGEKSAHSREFRSNVVAEQPYWQRFVRDAALIENAEGM